VKTWLAKSIVWAAPLWVAAALCVGGACAADQSAPPVPHPPHSLGDPGNFFEARFGVFAHGVGSAEQGTIDLNGSLVTPRIIPGVTGFFSFLVPRVHLGGALNLSDRTSFGYTGFVWTVPVWERVFVEAYVGPAVHNGSLTATPTLAGLGCPVLFHSGASVGYRFNERWSVMGTFEHLSNGKTLFGVNCGTNQAATGSNQGLNNYGVRVGYSF
jgi:lipid A 3-O-deacylase